MQLKTWTPDMRASLGCYAYHGESLLSGSVTEDTTDFSLYSHRSLSLCCILFNCVVHCISNSNTPAFTSMTLLLYFLLFVDIVPLSRSLNGFVPASKTSCSRLGVQPGLKDRHAFIVDSAESLWLLHVPAEQFDR